MTKIKVVAIIGKSGAGKDRLLHEVLKRDRKHIFHKVVPVTTRPPRDNEVNGKDYYFVNEEIYRGLHLVTDAKYNVWFYGTCRDNLFPDRVNIMISNLIGIEQLRQCPDIDLYIVEVRANDRNRLLRQLSRDGSVDCEEVMRRYGAENVEHKEFFAQRSAYNIVSVPNNTRRQLRQAVRSVFTLGKSL